MTGKISFGQRGQTKTGRHRHGAPAQGVRCKLFKRVDVMLLRASERGQ